MKSDHSEEVAKSAVNDRPVPGRVVRACGIRFIVYAALPTTSYFLGDLHRVLELFSHFLHLYLLMAMLGTVLVILGKNWRWAAAGALVSIVLAGLVFLPPGASTPVGGTANLKVMQANVLSTNTQHDLFLDFVRREKPDVISVQEVDQHWANALKELKTAYPFQQVVPQPDNFGIAFFSKFPAKSLRTIYPEGSGAPAITATIDFHGKEIEVLAIHAVPPIAEGGKFRNRQLKFVHDWAAERWGMAIVVGDLNCTPWSPAWRNMLRGTGLVSARPRFRILGSWPAGNPARIPIDHLLVKGAISVVGMKTGPNIRSDHLPVVVDLRER